MNPLKRDTLVELHKAAEKRSNNSELLVTDIIPYSGLFSGEFAHMTSDWIDIPKSEKEPIVIEVPKYAPCPNLSLKQSGNITTSNKPCKSCRRRDGESVFRVPYNHRSRIIPVQEPRAKERIKYWFSQYDSIPVSQDHVSSAVKRVQESSQIDREVTSFDLRFTFVVQLASMGFDPEMVADLSGYKDATVPRIAQAFQIAGRVLKKSVGPTTNPDGSQIKTVSAKYDQNATVNELQVATYDSKVLVDNLKTIQPATIRELKDKMTWADQTVTNHLHLLKQEGVVSRVGATVSHSFENGGFSTLPVWEVTKEHTHFECDHCQKIFATLKQIRIHEAIVH